MATVWQPDSLWIQRTGVCTGNPQGALAHLVMENQPLASKAFRCNSVKISALPLPIECEGVDRFSSDGRCQEQEHLWQQFFLDPAIWWDNRRDKKSSRSPDFRHKGSGKVLWLNSVFKPAWVDEELLSLDVQMSHGSSSTKATSLDKLEPDRRVGSRVPVITAVTVSTLCQQGKLSEAVGALESLAQTNSAISQSLLCVVLKLCTDKKDLVLGRRVHDLSVKLGHESKAYLANHVLRMYACGGRLEEAMDVFTRVGKPDVITWGSIISAYAKHGKPNEAIHLYHEMRRSGVKANGHVFVAALQACSFAADLELGRKVHCDILHCGIPPNMFVGNCLVDMYAKCGELKQARQVFDSMAKKDVVTWNALMSGYAKCGEVDEARQIFDSMTIRDVVTWNTLISGYAEQGLGHEAFVLYGQMEQDGLILANHVTFACLLKACACTTALQKGRQLHSLIVERGLLDHVLVGNALVDMYAKCGELEDARRLFDRMPIKDVVTWNSLIAGYAKRGELKDAHQIFDGMSTKNVVTWNGLFSGYGEQGLEQEALVLYEQMEQEGLILADHVTFACLLKACARTGALQTGRRLHSQIVERGLLDNVLVSNCLVDLYAQCGELEEARHVFDSMATKDVVTWTALISGYAKQALSQEVLVLYGKMEQNGLILASHATFACLLKACASTGSLQKGRQLHSQIVERGLLDNTLVGNCLVDMYAKCGELGNARQVFDSMNTKDVVTWTTLIVGYAQQGLGQEALVLHGQMEQGGLVLVNHIAFACLIKACARTGALQKGRELHSRIFEQGLLDNVVMGNCLLDMYSKCGDLEDARQIFDSMSTKDVVTWTSLIAGYTQQGLGQEALILYGQMEQECHILADDVTFVCLLKACASTGALQKGKQLHSLIVKRGLLDNLVVGTGLVDMYAKCGELQDARRVFDSLVTKNVVTWNALIAGYAEQGLGQEALVLYGQMEQEGLVLADEVTFVCLLKACGSTGALQKGRQLHSQIVKRGALDDVVVGNCLVDMYAKCGELKDARQVFDSMATKNVVTWTAMTAGYAHQGLGQEALVLYGQMEQDGLNLADHFTFSCLLKACASTGALQKGRQLHSQIVKRGVLDDVVLGNCLVDMYAKCGELEDARRVFDTLGTKDVVTWNALISAYGTCDDGHRALACLEEMLAAGIRPDGTTFTCLLAACSHEGLVHEGRKLFDSMAKQHGIKPTVEHYNCMIDLFGRAGHLNEALKMLLSYEGHSNLVGLTALLNACKSHGDIEKAMWCFERVVGLEPKGASAYVLMANAFADAGRWTDVDRIETQRRIAGANKKPAVTTLEVNNQIHRFVVGERREDLALKVESTNARLKQEGGHMPHTKLVFKPLSEKEKEDVLCGHAEKLALAFGLLNTPGGTPLVVTKNLRMCSDCHSSTEIMSRLEQRNIVVRDGYRVHRFSNGCCSCKGRQ